MPASVKRAVDESSNALVESWQCSSSHIWFIVCNRCSLLGPIIVASFSHSGQNALKSCKTTKNSPKGNLQQGMNQRSKAGSVRRSSFQSDHSANSSVFKIVCFFPQNHFVFLATLTFRKMGFGPPTSTQQSCSTAMGREFSRLGCCKRDEAVPACVFEHFAGLLPPWKTGRTLRKPRIGFEDRCANGLRWQESLVQKETLTSSTKPP